jgi:hypothetical protein
MSVLLTQSCPYCQRGMAISRMTCGHCGIAVEGPFAMSRLAALPIEYQRFIEMFILAGGNLKQLAEEFGVSYPTIRSRLDKVIEAMREGLAQAGAAETSGPAVLPALKRT